MTSTACTAHRWHEQRAPVFSRRDMKHTRGAECPSFWLVLQAEKKLCRDAAQLRVHSYVDRGLCSRQLACMWQAIPCRQTPVIRHELKHDSTAREWQCPAARFATEIGALKGFPTAGPLLNRS